MKLFIMDVKEEVDVVRSTGRLCGVVCCID